MTSASRSTVAAWATLGVAWCSLAAADAPAAAPPLPPLRSLALEPAALVLEDGRDARKVLVRGATEDGRVFDLTSSATLTPESPCVAIDADGFVAAQAPGEGHVVVAAAGLTARLPVTVRSADVPPVRFVRDLMPVLARAGCNQGTCHGSAQGKNGFKLSLRGYDSDFDYQALVYDLSGRRINRVAPEESLMVLKPTAAVPHEGKQAVKPGSRYHKLLVDWIAEGTRPESASVRAVGLEIRPETIDLDLPGRVQQIAVLARYADGATRDVTREAICASSDVNVAAIEGNVVTAVRRGEVSLLVRYEGNYASRLVTIMGDRTGYVWVEPPAHNEIDGLVYGKLQRMKILPSELCTDAEFLRRVCLDLTGLPPAPERTRAFLADPAPGREKRERLVDALIGSEDFVEHWTNKWADLLQCNSEALGQKGVRVFREWIRDAIASNRPYDRFVRELLLAEGSAYHQPAVNYFRALREPGKITEDVSQTFLGVRFNCNKCHDHPFERWTMSQYYQFGAYFARVGLKRGTLGQDVVNGFTGDRQVVTGEEIVFRRYDGGEVKHPKTDIAVTPKVPFGEARDAAAGPDRREPFVDWMTSKDNPLFARSAANRLWSYFFGRGIIDPVDDIRAGNPPSNPALLDWLTAEFVNSGFDLRHLMRAICRSRTYQLSVVANPWNEDDRVNFSHAIPRRLTAEQLLDAIALATGHRPEVMGMAGRARAAEIPDGMVNGGDFLALFGRPKRKSACECERTTAQITMSHALNLINGPTLGDAVAAPGNRIDRLAESEPDYRKVIEALYLAILCRYPTEEEVSAAGKPHGVPAKEAAQDLAWALMNSAAFLFNR